MKALEFKITMDSLILKHWGSWKREDQEFILDCAAKNHVRAYQENDGLGTITFKGDDLFIFMYDVAYRYDIEII